jgi:type II secretory ATPase GspE/PulE/Tfp pilus assembly ATPase PilB-like protein
MAERKKLGELLIEGGLIDQYQLKSALAHQRQWGGRIGANVVKLGFISEDELVAFLSRTFNLPSVNLRTVKVPATVVAAVPKDVAKKYGIIPLQQSADKKILTVAMSDPTNLLALDEVTFLVNARITPVIASDTAIEEALQHYYDQTARMEFDIGARPSTEIDFTKTAVAESKGKAKQSSVSGKIDISYEVEGDDDGDVVVVEADDGDDEPMPNFDDLSGLDDVLVFSGGAEKTISLEAKREQSRQQAAPPATTGPRNVAPKKEAPPPTTDQLVMALVRVLIDKGIITKEELLSRLK